MTDEVKKAGNERGELRGDPHRVVESLRLRRKRGDGEILPEPYLVIAYETRVHTIEVWADNHDEARMIAEDTSRDEFQQTDQSIGWEVVDAGPKDVWPF